MIYVAQHLGPYYCAQGSVTEALTACMDMPELIDVSKLVNLAKQDSKNRVIDATSDMENSRVFLISGTRDTTVKQGKNNNAKIASLVVLVLWSHIRLRV